MRRGLALALASLLLAAPVAGLAAPAKQEVVFAAIMDAAGHLSAGKPKNALRSLRRLKASDLDTKQRGAVEMSRAMAYSMLQDGKSTMASLAAVREAMPDQAFPVGAQFEFGRRLGMTQEALSALNELIGRFPADVRKVDSKDMAAFVESVRKAKGDAAAGELTARLAAIGYGGERDPHGLAVVQPVE